MNDREKNQIDKGLVELRRFKQQASSLAHSLERFDSDGPLPVGLDDDRIVDQCSELINQCADDIDELIEELAALVSDDDED